MEEMFDVVDEQDRVIESLPRSVVHARKLLHRAVHVFVFNLRGELLIHQRSATKDEQPLMWNSSCSGHVSAGEDYDTAVVRELEEELGLTVPVEFLVQLPATPELAYEHSRLYRAVTDDPVRPDPGEIAAIRSISLDDLRQELTTNPSIYSPPFVTLAAWYLGALTRG